MTVTALEDLPGRGIKPLSSLLSHPRLALGIFCLVLLAGLPLVFIKGRSYYATTATVQVMPSYMRNLRDHGDLSFPSNTQYREFRQQQARSILRYDIVRDALRSLGEEAAVWRLPSETESMAVQRLRHTFSVRAIPDTYMIDISRQAEQAEGLDRLVNAVVNTYVERMQEELVYGSGARIHNLTERRDTLAATLDAAVADRSALALELGISAFSGEEENPYDRIRSELRMSLGEAKKQRFAAEARLQAFLDHGETDIDTRSIQDAILVDPGLANLKANLLKRRADVLTQVNGLTEEHLAYQELDEELQRIDREIETQTQRLGDAIRSSLLARYQATVDQARQVEANLEEELRKQETQAAHFAEVYNRALSLTHDIDLTRKEIDALNRRLNDFAAEENAPGFVRLVTPALAPEIPFGTGKKKLALLLIIAAAAAGLAAPTARDLLDRRLKTVNDVERVLGIPSLGWLIEQQDAPSCLFAEEQLRRMAVKLLREHDEQGSCIFPVSAAAPGAGSSDFVLALGRVLDSLGYRTLVVEANALRPDSRFSDIPRDGLADCLSAGTDPLTCVIPADDRLPARLPVGRLGGKRHLAGISALDSVLGEFQHAFSFILIDAPPLTLSADAELIARKTQQLLLLVESEAHKPGELRRVRRILEAIDPRTVGIVINRIRPFLGGGYLRSSMIEYLSGRKSDDYFTTPLWKLRLRSYLFAMKRRRIGYDNA